MRETGRNQTTAPTKEPVSLTDAKDHLREDLDGQDDVILGAIEAARELVEDLSHRWLITQVWDIYYDDFPVGGEPFTLPRPPIQSVDQIDYVDTDGNTQTLAASKYQVNEHAEPAIVRAAYNTEWPEVRDETLKAVTVTITGGFGDNASDVPQKYKQAMYMILTHWYDQARGAVIIGSISKEIELGVKSLLNDHARPMIA